MKKHTKQLVTAKSDVENPAMRQRPTSLPDLGRRLLALYDAVGTRLKAAEIAGRSTDQLAKWAKGHAEPPFAPLAKLCEAAGINLEWLAFERGKGPRRIRFGQGLDEIADQMSSEMAQQSHSQAVRRPNAELELGVLSVAVRIADSVLREVGIRDQVTSDQFADFVQLAFDELARGHAEAETGALLARILKISR